MAGKDAVEEDEQKTTTVRRGSKSIWPWKKETDGSASFLRAARAGNLEKVLEFLKTNTDINTCNSNGLNALHLASKEGHAHVVSALIERNANVDAATKKGNTALHIASLAGQEDIVSVLVSNGASVNIQSQNGFTPLYMAAQENHDAVVRFLLANGANQSLATMDGFTPLAVALQQGHERVVAVLLENDARGKVRLPALHIAAKKDDTKAATLLLHTEHNPDVTSKSGFTPLHIASHYGNHNIAALLIQRRADVNFVAKHQITPLHVASKWGKENMVSLLVDKGAHIEAKTRDGLTPLHCAARSGHEKVVDLLLEKGAPITAKTKNGLAPLHMSSQGDHVDAARILLYHKAPVDDVTVDFLTALHVAAHCGHVRVAKLLLDRKADANSRALNGFTPLHIACKKNRIKVVELLLKHGASIEATTESGLTPLHVASFMGCMNIVIYLIQHGASADVPTVRGETPLHLAARANQTDIIRILLRNGAQVDARAREQQTALHIASRLGNSDIVVLLLQHGASVDAATKDSYTPLHISAKEGQEEVASVLLEHGASLSATTKKGFTPLHLAAKYGNMKVARLLLQKDARVDPQGKNGVTPLHVAAHYDHQNVALLLLDKAASPHATAKNGYTPLHIAARKNQMDIATTLLEYGASSNAESKAGFTPLHLSAQEGHSDMSTLLIEHGASAGLASKNGLTPLHLCSQEDRVNVGAILVKNGSEIDCKTKAGYTPLHVASHFGQMNMVRFLLQHGTKVDVPTQLGYTSLHQAAQQGHSQVVNLLLESKAEPNMQTNDGKTALSIAQKLGYISVVETLKIVTETKVTTNTTTTTEEKYKVVVPETMHETFMSESEDEGGDDVMESGQVHVNLPNYEGQFRYTTDDTLLGDHPYRYLTVDEMKSLGDDSLPIDVTRDEKMDTSFQSTHGKGSAPSEQVISPQQKKELLYSQNVDNIDVSRPPVLAGFLVSFMVDARGGAMRGCRHSGVRVIIPPRKAAMPMRVTCRYLKKDKLVHAPPLMEGEALASRILEMGPSSGKFLGPVIIEVPHFASLRGKEREIVILRSDNGETWREHTLEATEEAVQQVLNESFDGEELKQLEDLNTNRITRILTNDFPQYFAIVTRIRQEVHAIGPDGGMVSSTVVPQVQAVFPHGALTKKIKVGLQAQPISTDLVAKLLGNRVAVSPIVTVEPRRRKFHKPITLTIPVPQAASKGMINQYSGEVPTLRLLCSITGGTTRAQWEDVTGSTNLTFVNDCVSFTTTVSARFWLLDCTNVPEATRMATELYREAIHVPFMANFVVFSKRHQQEEARVRVFCMTDDKEDKTLETQENFIEVAKSRDVEVLEGKSQYLEFAGNLVPVTKSGDQLAFTFYAFRENRLPFTVRVKDPNAESVGRVAFMKQPKVGRGDPPQTPICNLNLSLPETVQPEPAPSEPDLLALEKKYTFLSISKAETIHKADLRLPDIANMLSNDWVGLAKELEISDSDIDIIKSQYPNNIPQQAIVMLRLWMQTLGNKATGNTLEKGLRAIDRVDIVNECICNLEVVTDDHERIVATEQLNQSNLAPIADITGVRDLSLEISMEEKDIMKEAESAEEDDERIIQEQRRKKPTDLSPTYETEEKKYAAEEKVVKEQTVSSKIVTTKGSIIKEDEKTIKTKEGLVKKTSADNKTLEEKKGLKKEKNEKEKTISDGVVEEVMISEKKTSQHDSQKEDKQVLLQKLGEELGKLDDKLEEKFKEKKLKKTSGGPTQTSAQQMDQGDSAPSDVEPPITSPAMVAHQGIDNDQHQRTEHKSTSEDCGLDVDDHLQKENFIHFSHQMTKEITQQSSDLCQPEFSSYTNSRNSQTLSEGTSNNIPLIISSNVKQPFQKSSKTSLISELSRQSQSTYIPTTSNITAVTGSPTEDSSEDHAEIDRTSTERSADSVRLDQDIIETKTDDEAPDFDDELLAVSPGVLRPHSFEEDTDITTPIEMREEERDSTNSILDDKNEMTLDSNKVFDEEEDAVAELEFNKNAEEEIKRRIENLKEKAELDDADYDMVETEAVIIQSTVSNIQDSASEETYGSLSEAVGNVFEKLGNREKRRAKRTESTVVETGSSGNQSPNDEKYPSLSDLLEPHDLDRETLDEEFEVLAAEVGDFCPLVCSSLPSSNLSSTLVAFPSSTELKSDVGVVFTEHKESRGGEKLSTDTTTGFTQHTQHYISTTLDDSRPMRRHERTYSQATNIITQPPIEESMQPYSERKQFWESVSKTPGVKSETESDTGTATDGTIIERVSSSNESDQNVSKKKDVIFRKKSDCTRELPSPDDISFKDVKTKKAKFEQEIKRQSSEIEETLSWKRSSRDSEDFSDPSLSFKEEMKISKDISSKSEKERIKSVTEVKDNLNKIKTVEKNKRDHTEKSEICSEETMTYEKKEETTGDVIKKETYNKEDSNLEESLDKKQSKKKTVEENQDGILTTTEEISKSFTSKSHEKLKEKSKISIASQDGKLKTITHEEKSSISKDIIESSTASTRQINFEKTSLRDTSKLSSSDTTESTTESFEQSESAKESSEASLSQSDNAAPVTTSSSSKKQSTITSSVEDHELSDLTEDSTEIGKSSEKIAGKQQVEKKFEEERRVIGDTEEVLVREITTTREGDQEHRVVKETKTQATHMPDGSTVKTTSVTTFTTQLDRNDSEERSEDSFASIAEKDKCEQLSQTKLWPDDELKILKSPIHVPKETIEDIVWEVSQEQSEILKPESIGYLDQLNEKESIQQKESETTNTKSCHDERARELATEIVEEVKTEAIKRSPITTPGKEAKKLIEEKLSKSPGDGEFTSQTAQKIEKYIEQQLSDEKLDEEQLNFIETVAAKKNESLKKRLGDDYQISIEITDEDLKSSGADLSPIEHHMERLRQMTEEEDPLKYCNEPSEPDESEESMIIHDNLEENFTSGYDQANEMFNKTLDTSKGPCSTTERVIDTISEEALQESIIHFSKRKKSREELEETAKEIVMTVTNTAMKSEMLRSKEEEEVKKSSKCEILKHEKSLDRMESSMTESVEECSAAESSRAYDSKYVTEMAKSSIQEEQELSPPEEVKLRKKSQADELNRKSGTDFDTYSSSGESHYFTADGSTETKSVSRPCSSDFDNLLSGTPGSSEYDTALTSQDGSRSSHATTQEFSTAPSSLSSRDSMKSVDSESSGHLASIELSSEASETLVPSSMDLERDMELLDQEILEEEEMLYSKISESQKSDEIIEENVRGSVGSKMKRSMEMTFHPEPKPLASQQELQEQERSSNLEESIFSESSNITIIERGGGLDSGKSSFSSANLSSSNISEQPELKDMESFSTQADDEQASAGSDVDSPRSVTITATSIPSADPDQATATMCTQVTSEVKDDHFFRIKGPIEVNSTTKESGDLNRRPNVFIKTLDCHSLGPDSSENCEPEADQDLSKEFRENEEYELQFDLDDKPESDMHSNKSLFQGDIVERPKTPEPGSISNLVLQEDPENMTEVDKRFSAVFSLAYEEPDSPLRKASSSSVPDIKVTEHLGPLEDDQRYPDLESDLEFPDIGSQSSVSSATTPKSSTTDSDHGREYCLDGQALSSAGNESQSGKRKSCASKREPFEEDSPVMIPATIRAIKLDTLSPSSSDSQGDLDKSYEESAYSSSIEEQRRWLEMQFEQNASKAPFEYPQPTFVEHIYSGPLEDIEEEKEDYERRDIAHITKTASLSSTPDFDVLAGKKFFTKSNDNDDISMSSLQEFENLEQSVAIENAGRRSSSGSQESLNGKRPNSGGKSCGDDISVSSFSSLNEFERLEIECQSVEQLEAKIKHEELILSEIEEGHESQVSESESCETMSDADQESPDNYEQKFFEIDEIIRQAQTNVEKFETQGVSLKDIVGSNSLSTEDRTPSIEPHDSLEDVHFKAVAPSSSAMTTSIDSLENKYKRIDNMATSIDSIESARRDMMATSIDSLGCEGDISSGSEMISKNPMEWSTDSLEPTNSQTTHTTFPLETDSVSMMSGSFASACSNTLVQSNDDVGDLMSSSLYIPEGELPEDCNLGRRHHEWSHNRPEGLVREIISESVEPEFSTTVSRSVTLPSEAKQITFSGPDAQQNLSKYIEQFDEGEHVTETESVDASGNVHIQKVVQKRFVMNPQFAEDKGLITSEPEDIEAFLKDAHGNVTKVVRRTVISTSQVEADLIESSAHTLSSHSKTPPSGSHCSREPLPTSLEPNTASGTGPPYHSCTPGGLRIALICSTHSMPLYFNFQELQPFFGPIHGAL